MSTRIYEHNSVDFDFISSTFKFLKKTRSTTTACLFGKILAFIRGPKDNLNFEISHSLVFFFFFLRIYFLSFYLVSLSLLLAFYVKRFRSFVKENTATKRDSKAKLDMKPDTFSERGM